MDDRERPWAAVVSDLLTSVDDSVALYEPDGRVLYLNPTTERIFAVTTEAARGRALWEIFPEARGNLFHRTFERVARTGAPARFEQHQEPWGAWYEHQIYRLGGLVCAWARDITDAKVAAQRLELLAETSHLLAAPGAGVAELLETLVRQVTRSFADACSVSLADEGGEHLGLAAWALRDGAAADLARQLVEAHPLRADASLTGQVYRTRQPLFLAAVDDVDRAALPAPARPEDGAASGRFPARSLMMVPVEARSRAFGVLQATRSHARPPFTPEDLRLLVQLAERTGLALENARLWRSREDAMERTRRLQEVTAGLAAATSVEQAARVLVDQACVAAGAAAGAVALIDPEAEELQLVESRGHSEQFAERFARLALDGRNALSEAVRRREPLFFADAGAYAQAYPRFADEARSDGHGALAVLPLVGGGRPLGALLLRFGGARRFDGEDRDVLLAVASQGAQAIERVRLNERERRAAARQRVLAEASHAFSASEPRLDRVLEAVVRVACEAIGDFCVVTLRGEDGRLRVRAARHADAALGPELGATLGAALERAVLDADDPISGAVAATGQPLFWPRVALDEAGARLRPELASALDVARYHSLIVVPLRAEEEALGTLSAARRETAAPYTRDDLALLEDLAERAALAIQNARLYRRAEEEAARLAEADRRKDEFLAMLAHELRNPLAPMRLAAHMLRQDGIDAARIERLHAMIARQTDNLARLVDDLLDVARITRGKVSLAREPLDIGPIVARAVEAARAATDRAGQELSVALPAEAVVVDADAVRMEQILGNLLGNASKYTPAGGRIAVRVEAAGGWVEIRVQDTGVGIAPEMLSRVFDLFEQVDTGLARAGGGLGIGLTVVRRLVEMHGGTVEARSEGPGQGSAFVVRLPVSAVAGAAVAAGAGPSGGAAAGAEAAGGGALRALVVDDNPDIADSLAALLAGWGHEVRAAHSGAEALGAAAELRPDLVVLDIGLPGMDGYEVARALRRDLGGAPCLVALTGYGQDRDRRRATEAGFDHHLVKPPDVDALAGIVDALRAARAAASG